jgi:hypothetical protein
MANFADGAADGANFADGVEVSTAECQFYPASQMQ